MNSSGLEPPLPLLHPKRKLSAGEKGAGMAIIAVCVTAAAFNLVAAILLVIGGTVFTGVAVVHQVRYSLALRRVRVVERPRPATTTRRASRSTPARPALSASTPKYAPVKAQPISLPVTAELVKTDPVELGRQARLDEASIADDPYRPGTPESDAWLRGWAGFRS